MKIFESITILLLVAILIVQIYPLFKKENFEKIPGYNAEQTQDIMNANPDETTSQIESNSQDNFNRTINLANQTDLMPLTLLQILEQKELTFGNN